MAVPHELGGNFERCNPTCGRPKEEPGADIITNQVFVEVIELASVGGYSRAKMLDFGEQQ